MTEFEKFDLLDKFCDALRENREGYIKTKLELALSDFIHEYYNTGTYKKRKTYYFKLLNVMYFYFESENISDFHKKMKDFLLLSKDNMFYHFSIAVEEQRSICSDR
ncbi:hypothetical protein HI814_14210 [Ralstonia solanacearum]|nr:hypothetical protein HI814_14210 [Ralstonia solanacearum]QKM33773.1 hypothetical protein HI794_14205 [Ralstonia solanacearum]QKM38760.1 hypothetical protein HI793_14215 [Ralstonia solanacearum]